MAKNEETNKRGNSSRGKQSKGSNRNPGGNNPRNGARGNGRRKGDDSGKETGIPSSTRLEDIHSNDERWWNRSELYDDATSIQANRFPGYLFSPSVEGIAGKEPVADPSVMTIEYSPTIGLSHDYQSPINRSFTSMFAEIVAHTNSGNPGCTKSDFAMLSASAASILTNFGVVKRAYGVKNVYSNKNANYPRVFFEAMGFDGYDTTDWERVRAKTKILIQDFNSLMIPKYVSLFDRAFQLGYNIYADENSEIAQYYIFKPVTYYVYSDVGNTAVAKDIPDRLELMEFLDLIDEQLKALRTTSNLGTIMGAYRRAFGEGDVLRVELMSIDDVVSPWYDQHMTWQINNMSIINKSALDLSSLDVEEDVVKDLLLSSATLDLGPDEGLASYVANVGAYFDIEASKVYPCNYRLNSYDGDTSKTFFMEATRLMVVPNENFTALRAMGTEIVHQLKVYKFAKEDGDVVIKEIVLPTVLVNEDSKVVEQLYTISKFRNHPPIPLRHMAGTVMYPMDLRDYYVTVSITHDQLAQLHEAALQSCYIVNTPVHFK